MCLLFDYVDVRAQVLTDTIKGAADAAKKLALSQHDDGSCDNLQIGIISTTEGVDVISRLPVKSKTAKIAMYSIPSECLGEGDKYFVKCDKISCVAHYLNAWMNPGDHVEIPVDVEIPIYRGIGGGGGESASAEKAYTRPTYTFPEGKCITDTNGTKFLFKSGAFAKTDKEIDAGVMDGTFRDISDYLLSMKDAAWTEFKRQLKNNGIRMSMLFGCTGEFEKDGTEVVEPEAAVVFMDLLYPNLVPGHDILVCLPPAKDGELVMEAAFNVRLSYPHFPGKVAIMGAQHNDMATEWSEQKVEENFYIYSNMELICSINNPETTTTVPVLLHKADSFLPQNNVTNGRFSSDLVQAKYDALIASDQRPDVEAWYMGCKEFQGQCRDKLFEQLKSDGASYGLKAFNQDKVYATNLIGMNIPKITTFVTANIINCVEQASAENVVAGMKRMQAEESSSPPKRAAAAPVEVSDADMVPASREEDATHSQPSEDELSVSEAAEAALQKALAKLIMKPKPGTEAMVAYLAKSMNESYMLRAVDGVDFQIMTDEHKMQIALIIESMAD